MKSKNVRLSKNVIPLEYDITLEPDLKNFTFQGFETIKLSLLKSTKELVLHSKELEVETAEILLGSEKVFAKISYEVKEERVILKFPKIIPKGQLRLTLVFKGILNDKMRGFYKSKYFVGDQEHHMATTQFEATDARRAFPCFDEPAHKSVFHVSLVVEKGKTSISNTLPISVKEHRAGFEIVRFSPTPKMSTYLLAFIVGNFEFIEAKTRRGVQVRVYTTPSKVHQAEFALSTAIKTLEFYEKYFDINYPLQNLDMIAIPDFQAGAMENWGLVTYRESALLVDPLHSSHINKQWVALVIAHELAHQWFGNLVTMEWWTHLWLNEGFASYIEYLAVDKLFPDWDIWTQFSTNDLGVALRLDSLYHTHPIEIEVHHPSEIGEIFDEVSYYKGASIIRMLAGYLGEQDFRDGLRYYLKKHSYKNTETVHLWQAFEKVSKKPVAKVMKNWTSKPGYPVVEASMKGGKINFSQSRFFMSPISKKKANDKTKWEINIIFKKNKVNFGETGFYRTAYSKELLEKLRTPIEKQGLSARDRLGVVRDLFALAESGDISSTLALEFLDVYKKENNYSVRVELATGLSRVMQLIAKSPAKDNLNKFISDLFYPTVVRLGFDAKKGEDHGDTLLRSLAISLTGKAGNTKVVIEARKRFNSKHIPADLRAAIYSVVATNGGIKEYETLIKKYKEESLHEEKNRIGNALGDFKNPKILKLVADFALSSYVRPQDTISILSGVASNPLGRDVFLGTLEKNWKLFVSRYGDGGHTLGRLVKAISGTPEEKHLKFIKNFFAKNEAPGAKRAVDQVLERIEGNLAWYKRDSKKISEFLKKL